ncbi:MAG: DUF2802 domain-containing protein [Pseudomonadota bacterium]
MILEFIIKNLWSLSGLAMAALVCIGVVLLALWVKRLHQFQPQQESMFRSLQNAVTRINLELQEERENRKLIEVQLKTIRTRLRQLDLREPQAIPYNHAITMVKRGAAVHDLIAACGLSQGEAELIIAVHGAPQ